MTYLFNQVKEKIIHGLILYFVFVPFREMDDKVTANIPEEVRWSDWDTFLYLINKISTIVLSI